MNLAAFLNMLQVEQASTTVECRADSDFSSPDYCGIAVVKAERFWSGLKSSGSLLVPTAAAW